MGNIELNKLEEQILKNSSNIEITQKRIKSIKSFAIVAFIGSIFLSFMDISPKFTAGLLALYIAITAFEKIAYGKAVIGYKNLIQKLVTRLEEIDKDKNIKA